jgi:2,3,4,5-tetrahydropyridine-2-carboxylate N-succinyltransferase
MQVRLRDCGKIADRRFQIAHLKAGLPNPNLQSGISNLKSPLYFSRMQHLKSSIERLASLGEIEHDPHAREVFLQFRDALTDGKIRAAEKKGNRWIVNTWVKQGILIGFRLGELCEMGDGPLSFVDKDTFPARRWKLADRVRVVPGGSSARSGAYVAPSVICMPPMFINVGAYVDEGTMVDSHALVGSCAQVGKRVHLSAAAQIGGVLEPVNAAPVVIEDDVLIGGNCGVYEGTLVRARAVLGAGTILTRSTPVYDIVHGKVHVATADAPLEIPENAVVVPGSRALKKGKAAEWNLSLYTPVIVKYRDEKTDRAIELENLLR